MSDYMTPDNDESIHILIDNDKDLNMDRNIQDVVSRLLEEDEDEDDDDDTVVIKINPTPETFKIQVVNMKDEHFVVYFKEDFDMKRVLEYCVENVPNLFMFCPCLAIRQSCDVLIYIYNPHDVKISQLDTDTVYVKEFPYEAWKIPMSVPSFYRPTFPNFRLTVNNTHVSMHDVFMQQPNRKLDAIGNLFSQNLCQRLSECSEIVSDIPSKYYRAEKPQGVKTKVLEDYFTRHSSIRDLMKSHRYTESFDKYYIFMRDIDHARYMLDMLFPQMKQGYTIKTRDFMPDSIYPGVIVKISMKSVWFEICMVVFSNNIDYCRMTDYHLNSKGSLPNQ